MRETVVRVVESRAPRIEGRARGVGGAGRRLALVVAALGIFAMEARAQSSGIPVGTQAPGAEVETLDGKPADLGAYVGDRPVVIEFWATWCSLCAKLMPTMESAKAKYGDRVRFVGVAVGVNQSPTRVKRYAAKHRPPFEILYDRTGAAVEAYKVPGTSYVVVPDRAGKVVYTGLGGEQDIEAAIRRAL